MCGLWICLHFSLGIVTNATIWACKHACNAESALCLAGFYM